MAIEESLDNYCSDIQKEHSLPSPDQSSSDTMSVIPVVVNNEHTNPDQCNINHQNSCESIIHGCSSVNNHQLIASTSPTGRHSKLQLRRKRNCGPVRKSKTKRDNLLQKLEEKIRELEMKQSHLLSHIENLDSYKNNLKQNTNK